MRHGYLVTVFLEDLNAVSSVLVAIGFGKDLKVVLLDVAQVLDLASLDQTDINI